MGLSRQIGRFVDVLFSLLVITTAVLRGIAVFVFGSGLIATIACGMIVGFDDLRIFLTAPIGLKDLPRGDLADLVNPALWPITIMTGLFGVLQWWLKRQSGKFHKIGSSGKANVGRRGVR